MRVLLAGGGSAGHIEPALALADALRRAGPDVEITCLGTERGLETRLIPLRGYPLELIPAVPMPLVSAGLSSLLSTLVALGMLMSFARLEPGAQEALAARGPGWPLRVLSWLGPSKRKRRK